MCSLCGDPMFEDDFEFMCRRCDTVLGQFINEVSDEDIERDIAELDRLVNLNTVFDN